MRLLFLRKEEFLMQVSEKCKELLQEFNVSMLMSNILVADLEIIQW